MDKKLFNHIFSTLDGKDAMIVKLLANDLRPKEMAEQIGISVRVVEARILSMRRNFKCNTVAGLVALFFRNKVIS